MLPPLEKVPPQIFLDIFLENNSERSGEALEALPSATLAWVSRQNRPQ